MEKKGLFPSVQIFFVQEGCSSVGAGWIERVISPASGPPCAMQTEGWEVGSDGWQGEGP